MATPYQDGGYDPIEKEEQETTLENVEEEQEEENLGHKAQTYLPEDDGVDDYFDEQYFDK